MNYNMQFLVYARNLDFLEDSEIEWMLGAIECFMFTSNAFAETSKRLFITTISYI